ncbi:alginate export family protein [Woodsholea maritima]|uniref:alginate export family protein n=1 Tax=Woodsholea maritima TaxID=240237 RepID=UPI000367C9A9|nr:alginate export family protein [Woodsholea maritima]
MKILGILGLVLGVSGIVEAQEPWRLDDALTTPDWLSVSGETRWRYESLDGQFRAGMGGSDQAFSGRTLIQFDIETALADFTIELQDSRVYLDDSGSALSSSMINTADILQAYARFDVSPLFNGAKADFKVGRMSIDVGSQRFQGRNGFRNTIDAFTGADLSVKDDEGGQWRAFLAVPVARQPADFTGLQDNQHAFDEENWNQQVFGLHYTRPEAFGASALELFVFGLTEQEKADRRLYTPGFRVVKAPKVGEWDWDLEVAVQVGEREDRDVRAATLHGGLGYSWDHAWRPRLALEYEYASGNDPDTADFERYDPLYGLRRTDFGQTGISGPLRRANVSAPGVRLTVKNGPLDGRLVWKAASLAANQDAWAGAGVVDPAGASGRFIGHHFDTRWRYWAIKDQVRLEVGGAWFIRGRFGEEAPNANDAGDSLYGYGMVTVSF